jgi:hypothetical protein
MTPEQDASQIWESAASDGIEKYRTGVKEHGGGLWRAGAGWYAEQIKDESIDLIAYLFHLRQRLNQARTIAAMLKEGELEASLAADALLDLLGSDPPKKIIS